MAHRTRSRQASALLTEKSEEKVANKKPKATEKLVEKKTVKTREAVLQASTQNQNKVSTAATTAPIKSTRSRAVLGSKPVSNSKENTSHNAAVTLKSPVLRDRTNVNNKVSEDNCSSKKDDIKSDQNTKVNKQSKASDSKNEETSNNLKVSSRRVVKNPVTQEKNLEKNLNVKSNNKTVTKSFRLKLQPIDSKSLSRLKKASTNSSVSVSSENSEKIASQNSDAESQNLIAMKKKAPKRKNITLETVEKMLNEDDRADDEPENQIVENDILEDEVVANDECENLNSDNENVNDNNKVTKKFFKSKVGKETSKPIIKLKTSNQRKPRAGRKVKKNDSTLSLEMEEVRDCAQEKNLRSKAAINYCELSKLSQTSNPSQENSEKEKSLPSNAEIKSKGVPIYKTIRVSQEVVDNKEAVYEFFYDTPDSNKKGKKKKITRRPAVKRIKKTTSTGMKKPLKTQKKIVKKAKVPQEEKSKIPNSPVSRIPEILENVGESTLEEASTLKIKSIESLDGSNKINLTATPSVAISTNSITSQPTLYKNMINHSLIRKSLSPIKKVSENFDAGSPWRSADTFSRVQKMVQSTPQINKVPLKMKKLPVQTALQEKTIHSQSTIHLSTNDNCNSVQNLEFDKNSDFISSKIPSVIEKNFDSISTKKISLSPRKFGTEISNVSSGKSTSGSSMNSRSSVRSLQPTSSKASFEELKDQEDIPMIAAFANKENISPRASRSPRKKCTTPCPFRFEKIRSPKKLVGLESKCTSPQKENKDSESGLAVTEKPKIPVMRQTNLNTFLNLNEMPESSSITTADGIFDDICSTPISNKERNKTPVQELNVENAFGFVDNDDDADIDEALLTIRSETTPTTALKKDVVENIFPKTRGKSALPARISRNTVKQALRENVKKKKPEEPKNVEPIDESDSDESGEINEVKNDKIYNPQLKKKEVLDSISFSDTFDVLSQKEELESKIPDEVPLFVDLEPAHFTQPPRRAYNKRKRDVCFNLNNNDESEDDESSDYDDDDCERKKSKKKPKPKKKKESKLSKEHHKRMQEWVKSINDTFEEIDEFDLVVE